VGHAEPVGERAETGRAEHRRGCGDGECRARTEGEADVRSITSQNGTSSPVRSQITRIAVRSDPIAPIAAPTSPTRAIAPAKDRPTGTEIPFGSMSPPGPTRPGTERSTAAMSAFQASRFPASHSAATEKPRSTAAKIEKSAR
jgi:hypothetical protein